MRCTSSFPFWMCNPSVLLFFFFPPTHFSVIPPSPSSIITFSPSLSCLISSTPLLPVSFAISHFSLQYYLSTLCTCHQNFSVFCHHLSLATGEGPPCVEICRSTVCGVCVCTGRHWVNVIKGWCSIAKRQRGRREEREGVKTSLNFYARLHFNRRGWRHDHMFSWDFRRGGRKYRAAASARTREKIERRRTEEKETMNEKGKR